MSTITKEQALKIAREAGDYADKHHEHHGGWIEAEICYFATETFKLGRNAGLEEAVQMLQKTGATLPAKQEHEGGNAVLTGVSISMAAIESLKEKA